MRSHPKFLGQLQVELTCWGIVVFHRCILDCEPAPPQERSLTASASRPRARATISTTSSSRPPFLLLLSHAQPNCGLRCQDSQRQGGPWLSLSCRPAGSPCSVGPGSHNQSTRSKQNNAQTMQCQVQTKLMLAAVETPKFAEQGV